MELLPLCTRAGCFKQEHGEENKTEHKPNTLCICVCVCVCVAYFIGNVHTPTDLRWGLEEEQNFESWRGGWEQPGAWLLNPRQACFPAWVLKNIWKILRAKEKRCFGDSSLQLLVFPLLQPLAQQHFKGLPCKVPSLYLLLILMHLSLCPWFCVHRAHRGLSDEILSPTWVCVGLS